MTPTEPALLSPIKPREGVLVSVCFGELSADKSAFDAVANLAREVERCFRFFEVIVVADESRKDAYLALIHHIKNLRLFTVPDGTAYYRRRVIAAEEAIGDVVFLANTAELCSINPINMIERAYDEQTGVMATRGSNASSRSLGALLVFLGRMAGFNVNLNDLQTFSLPRTMLNHILAHPDPDLALRFPPRDARMPLVSTEVNLSVLRDIGFRRRLLLLQKLLVNLAPRLLILVTLTSALLTVLGLSFGIYVLGVWMVLDKLAPGWLTLSAALSLSAFFIGISIMGLSLGLQQLLARTYRDSFDSVSSEINRVDLFGQVASDLNIELEHSGGDSAKKNGL
jgi:hypothetical protein